MDKRRAFEMPVEQRMLLNAGHGPPPIPPGNSMASGISNPIGSSATSWFHRNNTCDDLGSRLALSSGFSEDGRYQQIGLNRPEIDERPVLLQIIKEKDQQLQQLKCEVHLMQTNTGQKLIGKFQMHMLHEITNRLTCTHIATYAHVWTVITKWVSGSFLSILSYQFHIILCSITFWMSYYLSKSTYYSWSY